MSFLGPIIWDLVPNDLKDIGNLAGYKNAIKKCSPDKCPCRLCKDYISNVGFIFRKEIDDEFFPFKKLLNAFVLAI